MYHWLSFDVCLLCIPLELGSWLIQLCAHTLADPRVQCTAPSLDVLFWVSWAQNQGTTAATLAGLGLGEAVPCLPPSYSQGPPLLAPHPSGRSISLIVSPSPPFVVLNNAEFSSSPRRCFSILRLDFGFVSQLRRLTNVYNIYLCGKNVYSKFQQAAHVWSTGG